MSKLDGKATAIGPEVTNGGEQDIQLQEPYIVEVTLKGTADLLMHRWNCEAVAEKAAAAKGSKAKKTDNIETFVYRNDAGELCLPGEYLRGSMINAAKFRQDPRSPRKSAMDMYKAGIVSLTELASFGVKDWNYEHRCRVMVQRNAVTRCRPAIRKGWSLTFQLMVTLPEYIRPDDFLEVCASAGRLIGIADFRPTYGRFQVTSFKVIPQE